MPSEFNNAHLVDAEASWSEDAQQMAQAIEDRRIGLVKFSTLLPERAEDLQAHSEVMSQIYILGIENDYNCGNIDARNVFCVNPNFDVLPIGQDAAEYAVEIDGKNKTIIFKRKEYGG